MQFLSTETVSNPDLNLLTTCSSSKLAIFPEHYAATKWSGSRVVGTRFLFFFSFFFLKAASYSSEIVHLMPKCSQCTHKATVKPCNSYMLFFLLINAFCVINRDFGKQSHSFQMGWKLGVWVALLVPPQLPPFLSHFPEWEGHSSEFLFFKAEQRPSLTFPQPLKIDTFI